MVAGSMRVREPSEDSALRAELLREREEHARCQKHDYSHVFRRKSRFDLIRLTCIIVGIEFAYAAETAFVSPLLLEIGIEHKHMTMVWALSPLLGLFLAPLLGSISDRCNITWGRRRPLILILSFFIFAGLILVAWGKDIGILLGDHVSDATIIPINSTNGLNATGYRYNMNAKPTPNVIPSFNKWAAIVIIVGTIMLDFSADNCQTPSRTYLLDICVPDDQARGLSMFTIMAGFGGSIGYALGGVNWEETKFGEFLGGNVKTVFIIVAILFVICCIVTLNSFREIPLTLIDQDALLRPLTQIDIKCAKTKNNNIVYSITKEQFVGEMEIPPKVRYSGDAEGQADVQEKITLANYLKSVVIMPKSLKILCFTNLLSSMGHTSYCLYFTDFVGESVFVGDPTAPYGSTEFILYKNGLRFGCWGMAIFALSCAIYSMVIERLIQTFGCKIVYMGGLLTFSIGMLLLSIFPTKFGVLIFSIPAGVISATIFTIPYLLVANYHASGIFKISMGEVVPLTQTRGLGTDVAVVSSMLFVAQIIVSLCIGPFISYVGSTNAIVYAASGLSLLAVISATQVMYVTY